MTDEVQRLIDESLAKARAASSANHDIQEKRNATFYATPDVYQEIINNPGYIFLYFLPMRNRPALLTYYLKKDEYTMNEGKRPMRMRGDRDHVYLSVYEPSNKTGNLMRTRRIKISGKTAGLVLKDFDRIVDAKMIYKVDGL